MRFLMSCASIACEGPLSSAQGIDAYSVDPGAMATHLFRAGTVLPLRGGQYRVKRAFKRGELLYYDLVGANGTTHTMPDVMEGMITAQMHDMARFSKGDHARWKGRNCRVTGRGWNVETQSIRYTIELDGRVGELQRIPENELTTA